MTRELLAFILAIYVGGLLLMRNQRHTLLSYTWSAFGFAVVLILAGQYGGWHEMLGQIQAVILRAAARGINVQLELLGQSNLVVPDPTGWSVLSIGIECSTLIEASVFAGIMLFYPRFPLQERLLRTGIGIVATFLINLVRLSVITIVIAWFGKPAVPVAHAFIGRLIFFIGIIGVYWYMLTLPTLRMVKRDLEVTGRSVL